MRSHAPATALAIAVLILLAVPSVAAAGFQTLYDDYRADGVIDGCAYTPSQLSSGLNGIPADVSEYDPGFSDAINAALEQAAAGCGVSPQAASDAKDQTSSPDGSPGPAVQQAVTFQPAGDGRGMPFVLGALIAALGTALTGAAVLAADSHYGWGLRQRLGGPGSKGP
jgi:hypothetical protein